MKKHDYHVSLRVPVPAAEAFAKTSDMSLWWTENIEGSSSAPGDVFTIHFGETFVTFKMTECIPARKITWTVTDCYLPWLKDKTEWTGTQVQVVFTPDGETTELDFIHIGLTPGVECYDGCVKGWDQYAKDSLYQLLTRGKGAPQRKVSSVSPA
ncbi:MAG: SRPBCC domain-containing protein [Bacteroidetes bacterium]|nr:SRPBCC domain-containing protein [Bacteroidota bacterium]